MLLKTVARVQIYWAHMNEKMKDDRGQSTSELAVMAAVLIVVAGLVVAAIRTKVLEKIGIINGG
ncbi:hypothetical protein ACWCQJ_31565 [Streptomyces olivaceus]|uniref:hypothetical protein n=1 Tax=Streptomyces olivaceus TaxID=47716 RepID=UPI001CC9705A|nr:hypothetical protein [Streptomyces olivaceus]MBZ6295899.1 hypothetical protein [Streptomyces olivaceus]MBZ6330877.1 hypothetical protein [Streptomyces olivaceus]